MQNIRIPLKDILRHVTQEIRGAHEAATAAGDATMKFEECELEFAFDVEKQADGSLEVWLLRLGGGVKRTEANTVRVKYTAVGDGLVAKITSTREKLPKPSRQPRRKVS